MFLEALDIVPGHKTDPRATAKTEPVISNLSRRGFIAASGTFVVGIALTGCTPTPSKTLRSEPEAAGLADVKGGDATPALWISIAPGGEIKITCHRSEMGQQVWTAMAQIVADELEAPWDKVNIVQALGDPRYGDQNTDGSRSVRYNFHRLRVAGAAMRGMLEAAAAKRWDVSPSECRALLGKVVHTGSGVELTFGDLAVDAAELPVPSEEDIALKSRDEWRYIGH
ncbi:MAG: molybdopterin cofactor-binding domain-containing protein, partial [Pseudomonadota bacterium]